MDSFPPKNRDFSNRKLSFPILPVCLNAAAHLCRCATLILWRQESKSSFTASDGVYGLSHKPGCDQRDEECADEGDDVIKVRSCCSSCFKSISFS